MEYVNGLPSHIEAAAEGGTKRSKARLQEHYCPDFRAEEKEKKAGYVLDKKTYNVIVDVCPRLKSLVLRFRNCWDTEPMYRWVPRNRPEYPQRLELYCGNIK